MKRWRLILVVGVMLALSISLGFIWGTMDIKGIMAQSSLEIPRQMLRNINQNSDSWDVKIAEKIGVVQGYILFIAPYVLPRIVEVAGMLIGMLGAYWLITRPRRPVIAIMTAEPAHPTDHEPPGA